MKTFFKILRSKKAENLNAKIFYLLNAEKISSKSR